MHFQVSNASVLKGNCEYLMLSSFKLFMTTGLEVGIKEHWRVVAEDFVNTKQAHSFIQDDLELLEHCRN